MTVDTNAPERIWAWFFVVGERSEDIQGGWDDKPYPGESEYIRLDLHEAAVRKAGEPDHIKTTTLTPAEQAAFESGRKAGLEEAARYMIDRSNGCPLHQPSEVYRIHGEAIRALIKDHENER